MLWENLREEEFGAAVEASKGVCVIPLGCIEAHGQHLPVGCDGIWLGEYAKRAAELADVVVFPTIYFGENNNIDTPRGTVVFPEDLLEEILVQCCKEIARNGFKKILILTENKEHSSVVGNMTRGTLLHKYNFIVSSRNESNSASTVKKFLSNLDKYTYLTQEDIEVLKSYEEKAKNGGHGCFFETGKLYDVCPELVRLDRYAEVDGLNSHQFDGFTSRGIHSAFTWVANHPDALASEYHEGMNERIAKAIGEFVTEDLAKCFNFLREETITTEYHKEWLEKNQNLFD